MLLKRIVVNGRMIQTSVSEYSILRNFVKSNTLAFDSELCKIDLFKKHGICTLKYNLQDDLVFEESQIVEISNLDSKEKIVAPVGAILQERDVRNLLRFGYLTDP